MSDERITILLQNLIKIADGNFEVDMPMSDRQDEIEAIAMGVEMLADELKSATVAKEIARRNERRLKKILENIGEGVLEVNSKQEVIYANNKALDILKKDEDELVGLRIGSFFKIKDTQSPLNLRKLSTGGNVLLVNAIVEKRQLVLSLNANILGGESTFITFLDVTEACIASARRRIREILNHERDRQEIACRIREEVAQVLNAVAIQFSTVENQSKNEYLNDQLRLSTVLLRESIKEIRNITQDLSPVELHYGLKDSLESLMQGFRETTPTASFTLRCINLENAKFDKSFEKVVYSIIESAIGVGVNHGNSSDIGIVVELKDDDLYVDYYDIGNGFEFTALGEIDEITSISDRVATYQGTIRLDSEFGMGLSMYIHFEVKELLLSL